MLQEAVGLAQAIDLDVQDAQVITLANPHPGFLLRSGLVESFASFIKEMAVDLAIVDHPLTPVQQRNLERAWQCKVIDRTALILEIFGARARTKEGQLQVELAALTYQKSRLVRSWTHLERQRGGFGFLGGPGESQLELDRRMITDRIGKLKEDIAQVRRTRSLQRHARERAEYPTIALVGYTNAGKSTLFNRLTQAGVTAKDMLFVTLDPSMRKITLPSGQTAIIADTVGFIADLPTQLIEAFRATLEEVQLADFILHVRDITHPETRLQKQAVTQVLIELGIEPDDERLIEVMNKADLLDEEERARLRTYAQRQSLDNQQALDLEGIHAQPRGGAVALSSLSGEGVDDLLALLDKHLSARQQIYSLTLPLAQGAALAWLYGHGKVIEKKDFDTKIRLKVALKPADYGRFINKFGKS
ncbi:MAG: GTPase HflX [Alphaproteobacteria bacterium]|nr:GTPase HflX [Alphaproteobacteria bacterium]